ncbi:MAG: hypothetical protein IPG16_03000 [Comamonadaceae bacterium]|nr:hypothetical protein [Comamonadaceae bacterium]
MFQTDNTPAPTEAETAAERRAAHVAALRAERDGYERRGLPERVKQVDAQIAAFAPEQAEAPKRSTRQR